MRRPVLATTLVGIAGLAIGLSGCGGSPSASSSTTTTTSATTTTTTATTGNTGGGNTGNTGGGNTGNTGTTTTTAAPSSQAMTEARAALLTRADMPANWTSTPSTNSSGGLTHTQEVQIAQCLGVPVSEIGYNPPEADAPEFDGPGGLPSVDDSIQVFPNATIARQQFATLDSPRTPQCLTQVFTSSESQLAKGLPAGATISNLSTTTFSFAPLADATTALLIRFTVNAQGQTVDFAISLVAVLDGRFGITLEGTSESTPMSASYLHTLAALNVSRLP